MCLTLLGPAHVLTGATCDIPDRFIVKAYDAVTSNEAEAAINTREYTLLLRDLQNQMGCDLTAYFMPISHQWWSQHLKRVVLVKTKPNKKLSVIISKKKIEMIINER